VNVSFHKINVYSSSIARCQWTCGGIPTASLYVNGLLLTDQYAISFAIMISAYADSLTLLLMVPFRGGGG
jgi:hypothetical protein